MPSNCCGLAHGRDRGHRQEQTETAGQLGCQRRAAIHLAQGPPVVYSLSVASAAVAFSYQLLSRSRSFCRQKRPLLPEPGPQLDERCRPFRRNRTAEVEEDLEGRGTGLVEELKATSASAVHVPRFLD